MKKCPKCESTDITKYEELIERSAYIQDDKGDWQFEEVVNTEQRGDIEYECNKCNNEWHTNPIY